MQDIANRGGSGNGYIFCTRWNVPRPNLRAAAIAEIVTDAYKYRWKIDGKAMVEYADRETLS